MNPGQQIADCQQVLRCHLHFKCFHFPFSGVFALLQAVAALKYLQKFLTKSEFKMFFFLAASVAAGLVFLTVVGLTWLGVIAPWSGRLEKDL